MKKIQSILLLIMAFAMVGIYASCTKDDAPNNGQPRIKYIRITAPESSDSLLVGAYQSNLIAIVGENLQDAQQIWFNDQKASLTPTYITSTSILVSVPSEIPLEINNTLKIIFANGSTLEHPFTVEISEPLVLAMNCEYVLTGNVATIRGDYFYEPLTVTFTGGVTGELVKVEDKAIQVIVPDGAQPGPVTVTTNFGETKSDFWFRDNRNIFISSDPFTGWWN
ncbi:MAG TPA: IPT/TIG domain-containing protein, partial [Agriterribacter sp.]|nr:IPT/TIG domain-containing protein [Agriterribacter sp.]